MVLFKKVTVTVLAVLLAVGMTACGGGQKAESGVPSTETSSMTAEEESADPAPAGKTTRRIPICCRPRNS